VLATLHDRKPRWVRDLPSGGRSWSFGISGCGAVWSRAARNAPGLRRTRRSGRGPC
jgi:hypothetical protein